ncbi:hypothetical protein SAMN04488103_101181 [Gemmobacter aquatilis]|uniref:ZIP Zinc transporter n=1 Tax=Gemmobacter aquatilis TaxID=933059 RepID=A0A1H7YFN4_9RHOB|nr:hypothetical protein [Gemmobacter aquatilis]SEM44743.1 hypothetical protein SAMN04488103_101181 [Gemmobacter aquatilis]
MTWLAVSLMAMTFVLGRSIHPLKSILRDRRTLVSFGSGIAAAYLFVGMMPELAEAMVKLDSMEGAGGPSGLVVYVVALLGFVVFYGLDHFTRATIGGQEANGESEARVYGYVPYIWLMTYVMVVEAGESARATLWYAIAMCCHFLTIDHSLSEKRGARYDRRGRYLLGLCVVLGWGTAQIVELSATMTALALGFVSGALTVNSVFTELSEGAGGRFLPFVLGSVLYAALLLGAGLIS